MADDRAERRRQFLKKLAELKEAAIADLERRGYDARGKTPGQIRHMLKRRHAKQRPAENGAHS
jgi:hypothetical protein